MIARNLTMLALCISAIVRCNLDPNLLYMQTNSYYSNPNLINNLLAQMNTTVSPVCQPIQGIGQPVLVIREVINSIKDSFDVKNRNTNIKIIFYKEKYNVSTYQTNYKLVVMIKSFSSTNYIAIEGTSKQVGYPSFDVSTYYVDSNIENIKNLMGEYLIDPNGFVACGDVKTIFNQNEPGQTSNNKIYQKETTISSNFNIEGNAQITAKTTNQDNNKDVSAEFIAQIMKLLQKK